jgi:alanyl aminopeptidase
MLARLVRHFALLIGPALLLVVPVAVAPVAAVAATERGTASPPAFRLGDAASPTRYELHLAIDPRAADFSGEVAIELDVHRAAEVLWLNATALDIDKVTVTQEGREIPATIIAGGEDFIGLRAGFASGSARVRFAYRGKLDSLLVEGLFRQQEGGEWYVLSQFQAIAARRALPCFDEPGWKTPWRITIDAPAANVVVANTPQTSAAAIAERPGWLRHAFADTRPLPTYLVALAVGPFDVVDGGIAGANHTPLRYLTPKGRGREARYAAAVTPRLLARLEDYFGIPYPFIKLDSITIPHLVTFGAMENAALITYGAELMLADAHEETPRFRELYASLAAHEMAHMWFGDLVTLAWWDDTWLNEAFASWMGSKVEYALQPAWDNGVQSGKSRHAALLADRLASARSIASPVENRNAIDDAFDDITYNKGEEVLAMFEAWIGPERFRAGVRAFLRKHSFGTATSEDFFRALGEAAGDSQAAVRGFKAFVSQPGAPLVDAALRCEGRAELEVRQQRFRPKGSRAPELEWTTPACFRYSVEGKEATHCAAIDKDTRKVELPVFESCPDWIVGNAGGRGHYVMRYEPALLRRIVARAASLPQAEAQALARDTLLQADAGLVPIESGFIVADAALAHESPNVRLAGEALLEGLRDDWLTAAQRKEKARIVARRLMPIARDLGWLPRPGDSDDLRELRPVVMRFAADRDEGAQLRAEARALALRWSADPASVDATVAPAALDVAGRFADAATFAKLESALLASENPRDRSRLLGALVRARDPPLRNRALALALATSAGKPRLDGRSAFTLLEKALRDDENRPAAFDYVRRNFAAVEAKLPKDTPSTLLIPMGRLCTPAHRAAFAALGDRAPRYMSGALRHAQALESIDLCLAARK